MSGKSNFVRTGVIINEAARRGMLSRNAPVGLSRNRFTNSIALSPVENGLGIVQQTFAGFRHRDTSRGAITRWTSGSRSETIGPSPGEGNLCRKLR